MNKTKYRLLGSIVILALTITNYFSVQAVGAQSIPQTIVYQNPSNLTINEIGNRFQTAIMSRGQGEEFFSGYASVGIHNFYIYLNADRMAGPAGMSSTNAQITPCTSSQKGSLVITNNVMMDTGDFCRVHDAIIAHTCLDQYPDVCPSESFFLHKVDGTRYENAEAMYRPNPSDPMWRKFFAYRALRELTPTDPMHLPLPGVSGIYLDNLDASFNQLISEGGGNPPVEFASNDLYDAAMVGFVHTIKQTIGTYKLIGNLNDLTTSWDPFAADMDGGLAESWSTNWNTTINSTATLSLILDRADKWIASGKTIYLITQGDSTSINNLFGLSMFMLVYQPGSEYRYAAASYANYYEIPEYFAQLGQPLGNRVKLSDSPLVFQRCFQSGSVTVDLSAKTGAFGAPCNSPTSIPASPTPTLQAFTPTATFTLTASPTPILPTSTPTAIQSTPTSQPATQPGSDVMYDDMNSGFIYSSNWMNKSGQQSYGGSYKMTSQKGSTILFQFTGQSFSILYVSGPSFGNVDIYVDGTLIGTIGQRTSTTQYQQRWDYTGSLPYGNHTLKLVTKNIYRNYVSFDALITR